MKPHKDFAPLVGMVGCNMFAHAKILCECSITEATLSIVFTMLNLLRLVLSIAISIAIYAMLNLLNISVAIYARLKHNHTSIYCNASIIISLY